MSCSTAAKKRRIDIAYDAAGQFDTITRYADVAGSETVVLTDYTFDLAGRLTGLAHSQDTTTLADYGWQYDKANRVTQFVSSVDGTADYIQMSLTGTHHHTMVRFFYRSRCGAWKNDECGFPPRNFLSRFLTPEKSSREARLKVYI